MIGRKTPTCELKWYNNDESITDLPDCGFPKKKTKLLSLFFISLVAVFESGTELLWFSSFVSIDNGFKVYLDNPSLPEDLRTYKYHNYIAGLGLTLGLYYNFSDRFSVGSGLTPNIVYIEQNGEKWTGTKMKGYEYNIFSNFSIISLKYRW